MAITKEKSPSKAIATGLRVSNDRMSVVLTVTPELASQCDLIDAVRADLARLAISIPLEEEYLLNVANQVAASGVSVADVEVCRGTTPVPPIEPRMEWAREFFASGYYVDPETKRIDYHRNASSPTVDEHEIIARFYPAQPGKDGCDVFGRSVPASKPRPREYVAGSKVIYDTQSGEFRAQCSGRVRLDGKVIMVVDVYQLSGGVGTASGNIDHHGSVVITGGVESEFKVAATGDIEVGDVIGAADINCGGNLTANKGISSAAGKTVIVKGNLHAKYLEHATVQCDGDVVVESEILDSSVHAVGKIVCAGRVMGGDLMSAVGIEVGETGTHHESRTTLIAGVDFKVVAALRSATDEAKKLKEVLTKLEPEVKKLEMLGSRADQKQRQKLTELGLKLSESRSRYEELTETRKKLAIQMQSHRDATIAVNKTLYPGTMLRVVDSFFEARGALLGPLTASLDRTTKAVVLNSKNTSPRSAS